MIGVDLVYIPEFKKQINLSGKVFLDKAFDKNELKNNNFEHLAGIWAAKEAVIKAKGNSGLEMKSIKVRFDKNGQPKAKIGKEKFEVSISHHGDYAVAVATGAKQ
jgi:phosphopantetheine--protein transferase-like protein